MSLFSSVAGTLAWTIAQFVDCDLPVKCLMLTLHNAGGLARTLKLSAAVDWLMGVGGPDAHLTGVSYEPPLFLAAGAMEGYGFAALLTGDGARAAGLEPDPASGLRAPLTLPPGGTVRAQLLIGWAPPGRAAARRSRLGRRQIARPRPRPLGRSSVRVSPKRRRRVRPDAGPLAPGPGAGRPRLGPRGFYQAEAPLASATSFRTCCR